MFAVIDRATAIVFIGHSKKRARRFALRLKRNGAKPKLLYIGSFEPVKSLCNMIVVVTSNGEMVYKVVMNEWVLR